MVNFLYAKKKDHNSFNRLISEVLTKNGASSNVNEFTYDAMGNRFTALNNELSATGKSTITNIAYSNNADNSLLKAQSIKNKQTPYVSYNYDANGNMLSKAEYTSQKAKTVKTTAYVYDYENRLVEIDYPTGSPTVYVYDGDGKRVKEISGTNVATYLYDGMNVIIERNTSGTTLYSYTRGVSNGGGISGIISMNKYSTKHKLSSIWYYHYDGSGNVVALTNTTGKVVQTYSYDAYGNLLAKTRSSPNSYMFSTKEYDSKSGLYYFGARYYDPEIGRWLSKDPLGMIDGPNMYLYCLNNPIVFIDPFGYCKKSWWGPENMWWQYLYNDGEGFTGSTWGERFWDNFQKTNEMVPGLLAPTGAGFITGQGTANMLDTITIRDWYKIGFGGATMGAATFTTLETGIIVGGTIVINNAIVGVVWEAGVAVGSAIRATTTSE